MPSERVKTKYPGVTVRPKNRLDGSGLENVYYIRYRRGGRGSKEIEEPVGRESEGMTAAKANKIRAARAAGKELSNTEKRAANEETSRRHKDRWTLDRLWQSYQDANPEHKSRKTDISRYNLHLAHLGKRTIAEIMTSDIDAIRLKAIKTCKKPATIRNILALLRAIINFGVERGYCAALDPTRLVIKMPRVDNVKTEILTDEQLEKLADALDEEPDQDTAALIRLVMVTGMRKGAVLALKWDDLDFERGIITLRGEAAKKGKTEHIPMNNAARRILESIAPNPSEYVFPGKDGNMRTDFRRMAKRVMRKAGLPDDFRPLHGLRHNFASRLASSGKVDMYTLQRLLTHTSPAMTQRYAHLRDETLRNASCLADEFVPQ